MPCQAMSCHAVSSNVRPRHAMPCHAMPYHAMSCHVMPCHAMPCHAMSCRVKSCQVKSPLALFIKARSIALSRRKVNKKGPAGGRSHEASVEPPFLEGLPPQDTDVIFPRELEGRIQFFASEISPSRVLESPQKSDQKTI